MSLELKLCAMRSVGSFVAEASAEGLGRGRAARLEESVKSLEEEKQKIEAFKRELPLCMHLLSEVIDGLKKEIECSGSIGSVFKEFMPIKSAVKQGKGGTTKVAACKDGMNWMSSAQLWSDSYRKKEEEEDDVDTNHDVMIREEKDGDGHRQQRKDSLLSDCKSHSDTGELVSCKGLTALAAISKEEKSPAPSLDLSLRSPAMKSAPGPLTSDDQDHHCASGCASTSVGHHRLQSLQQPLPRKARRCWSQELHHRFVLAIQQLGGAHVATPKQIRDLMKVDGLTNDEVKSHLQKYRLHTRRVPNSLITRSRQSMMAGLWVPQEQCSQSVSSSSGSPQSPLQLAGSAPTLSANAGESSEEDGKSDGYS